MKIILISFFIFSNFYFFPIFSDAISEEKANSLCSCLKNAKNTNKSKDKKACLTLREKHIAELGKSSEGYSDYVNRLGECEREMMGVTKSSTQTTYEEKIAAVCDCFKNEGKKNKPKCFMLQSEIGKSFQSDSEKKTTFNVETNACAK